MPFFAFKLELPFFWLESHFLPDIFTKSEYFKLNRVDESGVSLYLELLSLHLHLRSSRLPLRDTSGESERVFYDKISLKWKHLDGETSEDKHGNHIPHNEILPSFRLPNENHELEQDSAEKSVKSELVPLSTEAATNRGLRELHRINMVACAFKCAWLPASLSFDTSPVATWVMLADRWHIRFGLICNLWSVAFILVTVFAVLLLLVAMGLVSEVQIARMIVGTPTAV